MESRREKLQVIAVLEEMIAEIELSNIHASIKRERLEELNRRVERMRTLHEQERDLTRKARRNAS